MTIRLTADGRLRRRLASNRRAGTYAKRKARTAHREYLRENWLHLSLVLVGCAVIGVLPALLLDEKPFIKGLTLGLALAGTAGALAVTVVIQTGTGPTMAGEWAEGWTSEVLRGLSEYKYQLVNHVQVDRFGDVDHVVVGPGGCFVVETKWSATPWTRETSFLRQAVRRTATQARLLERALPATPVTPIVVLWGKAAKAVGTTKVNRAPEGVYVISGDQLRTWISGRAPGTLASEAIANVHRHLSALAATTDEAEEPVPPSLEVSMWSAAGVVLLGLLSFYLAIATHGIAVTAPLISSLVLLAIGALARRTFGVWGTAVMSGAVGAGVMWVAAALMDHHVI